ncbi:MAG: GHKL domain-containing protein [Chlamydiales bacterium]|nr:GHKL domain-containing protein [Chlamydiales bacterium]
MADKGQPTLQASTEPLESNQSFAFTFMAAIIRGIVGTIIAIFIFTQVHRIEDEKTFAEFVVLVDENQLNISEDLNTIINQLKTAGSLFLTHKQLSNSDINFFLKRVKRYSPLIQKIEWLPSNKEISTIYPRALEEAINKKQTIITSKHWRIKNESDSPYISIYTPIFDKNGIYHGAVSATILVRQLIEANLNPNNIKAMDIYIYDDTHQGKNQLLYFFHPEKNVTKDAPTQAKGFKPDYFLLKRTFTIANKQWTLVYRATPEFTAYTWQAAFSAGCAILITSFIVVTAFILLEIEKSQFSNVLHEEHVQEMEGTIDLLETTKDRLKAQENLASLGGLTAGIAHEIKNPLNFINNFSTLSMELLESLDKCINQHKSHIPQNEMVEIFESIDTLKENINTIHEQGSKANSTIQRMLAHSRGKPGDWQTTDIHKLLDEYINFSFHGMRAKDSTFNVKIEKEFDNSLNEVEVVSSDLSRVFLNLLNNAFQSVTEKKRQLKSDYKPVVTIKTQNLGNYFRITIRDNGLGVTEENKGKIFTPFFTTKPTGEGTGLGLSLSYNIVTQGHEGSLTFNSKENEYCEFVITIPKHPAKKTKEVLSR